MARINYMSLCLALVVLLAPAAAVADTAAKAADPAAGEPAPGPIACESVLDVDGPEISLAELERRLGVPKPQPKVCTQSNNCIHCTIPTFHCTCLCDVEMEECMNACGSNYNCMDQCEFDGQDCHEACYETF